MFLLKESPPYPRRGKVGRTSPKTHLYPMPLLLSGWPKVKGGGLYSTRNLSHKGGSLVRCRHTRFDGNSSGKAPQECPQPDNCPMDAKCSRARGPAPPVISGPSQVLGCRRRPPLVGSVAAGLDPPRCWHYWQQGRPHPEASPRAPSFRRDAHLPLPHRFPALRHTMESRIRTKAQAQDAARPPSTDSAGPGPRQCPRPRLPRALSCPWAGARL